MADATLTEVMEYFGYTTRQDFARDWKALDDTSKTQLKQGIGNKTYTY